MKLGLHYWNFSTPGDPALIAPTLVETAHIAEQAGVASFSLMPAGARRSRRLPG